MQGSPSKTMKIATHENMTHAITQTASEAAKAAIMVVRKADNIINNA